MSRIVPLPFIWDSEAAVMRLDEKFRSIARRQYLNGERYPLEVHEVRSVKSLRHYHASIKNIWDNLPDDVHARYPTPEHLRKWALIKCGFHNERSIVCETAGHAKRLAAFIKPMDEFAVIVVKAETIKVYTARSQSAYGPYKMTAEEFKESKNQVLDLLSSLVGLTRSQVEKESRNS